MVKLIDMNQAGVERKAKRGSTARERSADDPGKVAGGCAPNP
jgi:hypothetical protein